MVIKLPRLLDWARKVVPWHKAVLDQPRASPARIFWFGERRRRVNCDLLRHLHRQDQILSVPRAHGVLGTGAPGVVIAAETWDCG